MFTVTAFQEEVLGLSFARVATKLGISLVRETEIYEFSKNIGFGTTC